MERVLSATEAAKLLGDPSAGRQERLDKRWGLKPRYLSPKGRPVYPEADVRAVLIAKGEKMKELQGRGEVARNSTVHAKYLVQQEEILSRLEGIEIILKGINGGLESLLRVWNTE